MRFCFGKNISKGVTLLELMVAVGISAVTALVAVPAYQNARAVALGNMIVTNLGTIDEACTLARVDGAAVSGSTTDLVPSYLTDWPSAPPAGLKVRYPGAAVDTITAGSFALSQVNSVWRGTYNGQTLEELTQ